MRSARPLLQFGALALVGTTALPACIGDLERISDLRDLRVLAIRADPPEVFADAYLGAVFAEDLGVPPPPTPPLPAIRFDALVVDVRGTPATYTWKFCPLQVSNACLTFDNDLAEASENVRPGLRAMWEDPALRPTGEAPTFGPLEPLAVAPYDVTLDTNLFRHHAIDRIFFGLFGGSWPSAILEVEGNGEKVLAEKRMVLNLQDPAGLFQTLRDFAPPELEEGIAQIEAGVGFSLCPPAGSGLPASEGCVALAPRVLNTNPVVRGLWVQRGEYADPNIVDLEPSDAALEASAFEPLGPQSGALVLSPGEKIRILPVLTPESFETYEVLKTELQSRQIFVESRKEDISVAWFVSAGRIQEQLTARLQTRSLDTVYAAPDQAPADTGGIARVYMVILDGRGGTTWTWVDIRVATN